MRQNSKTAQHFLYVKYFYLTLILLSFLVMPIIAAAGEPHNQAPKFVTGVRVLEKDHRQYNEGNPLCSLWGSDLDGDTDAVATNYVDDTVAWYENNGSGGFTKHVIDSNLDGAYPVHVADLNRDGALDVLATGYLADMIVWYENNGSGGFTRHIIDANSNGAHSVYTTDLDGDNDTDVVTASQDGNTIAWYENDGSSNFIYHLIDNNAIGAKYAFATDLDGDNDIDIARASFFDKTIAWYENDGYQNFNERTIDTQADGAYYVLGTDLDGDGDTDLVSASQNDNTIAWYENNGYGGFTKRVIDHGAAGARAVFADDVDNDGDTDVLAASVNDDTIAWYRNDGRGIFIKQPIDIATGGAYGVSTANMNGDGQIDVIAASRDDYTITLYHQIKAHKASLARGSTLVINSDLLRATDVDNTPAELIYTVTDIPDSGALRFNGAMLSQGGTFTQADINNNFVSYVHNGMNTNSDSFNFTLIDGGQDGVKPGSSNFTLNIEGNPLTKVISDDFNTSSLNQSLWTFVNPLGDAVLTMTGTQASIAVPAGTSHDIWYSNLAPRIMQNVSNTDFDVEAKFESSMNSQYQVQGLIVQQDLSNFLRFDFVRDASNTRIFAASFKGGSPSVISDLVIPYGSPLYIRVNRQGDQWTQSYSYDGEVFMNAVIFNHAITVSSIGVYAGNHGIPGSSSPAFTGLIDYFFNTASPIVPQDGSDVLDPGISKQPLNRKIDAGMTATFTVVATGTAPFSYQWQKNGTDIQGAVNSSYTTQPTTLLDNGSNYRVNVTNPVGSVMSNSATLTISPITAPTIKTQPPNRTVAGGQNATFSVLAAGTAPLSYQWQKNGTNISGATRSSYTTPATNMSDNGSTFSVNVTNPVGSVMSDQARLTVLPSLSIRSDDFNSQTLDTALWTVVDPRGDAIISVVGNGTQDALLSIAVPQGQEHDVWNGNNAPRVMQSVSNTNFEIELKFQSQLTSGYQMQGVIIQQDSNNYLRFDFVRFPGSTNIFAASFAGGLPTTRYNVAITSGNPIYMRINRTGEQWKQFYSYDGTNWILAANFNYPLIVSSVGPFAGNALGSSSPAFTGLIDYFFDTSSPIVPEDGGNFQAPVVSIQPLDQTVTAGQNATFSVVATGSPPLSYQWQKNGTNIPGATNASYTTPLTTLSYNLSAYRVNVSNPAGNVLSNSATLTVISSDIPPTITTQPLNQTVTAGQNATFSVIATGSSPLSYQWRKNGTNIPGATSASYTTPLTNMSYNRSTYRVNVSNQAGSVLSNSATLTVLQSVTPPTITTQPSNQTVTTGQNATFVVVATGSSPLSYQWQKNGTNIPGATSASYTTPITNMSNNGSTYRINITNPAGSVMSDQAKLTVLPSLTIISDDFNSQILNSSLWTIIDPKNDSKFTLQGNGTQNALLSITVPAGISHDAWIGGNFAPRIMQSVKNTNFEIEVKFQSQMTSQYQIQGLIIQQDSNNYLRFDFVRNSATINIFAASFTEGYPTVKYDSGITTRTPLYLRINRTGDQWKQFYSYNGITWISAANFTHTLKVTSVGPYVGNHGIPVSSSPAFTGLIDYFFNTSSPVIPEDVPDTTSPITLWYGNPQRFGQIGVPQKWVNILGNADNEYGIATMNYSLNNRSVSNLSIGTESFRLQSIGDFNIEINRTDLLCGDNRVAINATDNAGNTKNKIVFINYSCNNVWPGNYTINWSNVTNIQDVAQVVDGLWTKETNSIRPTIIGYDRLINIGDLTWDDYEITVPVTLNAPLDPFGAVRGSEFWRWYEMAGSLRLEL